MGRVGPCVFHLIEPIHALNAGAQTAYLGAHTARGNSAALFRIESRGNGHYSAGGSVSDAIRRLQVAFLSFRHGVGAPFEIMGVSLNGELRPESTVSGFLTADLKVIPN